MMCKAPSQGSDLVLIKYSLNVFPIHRSLPPPSLVYSTLLISRLSHLTAKGTSIVLRQQSNEGVLLLPKKCDKTAI